MNLVIIQTTCPNKKEAKNIAKALVNSKLAACIQMSKVESFYMWKGEFCEDKEILLNIKTTQDMFKKIKSKIKELHSYDVPEIISIKIQKVNKNYKKFVKGIKK